MKYGCPVPYCTGRLVITDRFVLDSTDGYIEHVKTKCDSDHRHFHAMPTAMLERCREDGRREDG